MKEWITKTHLNLSLFLFSICLAPSIIFFLLNYALLLYAFALATSVFVILIILILIYGCENCRSLSKRVYEGTTYVEEKLVPYKFRFETKYLYTNGHYMNSSFSEEQTRIERIEYYKKTSNAYAAIIVHLNILQRILTRTHVQI
jgi:hypothetical protein